MNVTDFDFEDKLEITGIVIKRPRPIPFLDATIVEEEWDRRYGLLLWMAVSMLVSGGQSR